MMQISIKNLLHSESDALRVVLTQVRQLQRWNHWLAQALPDEVKLLEHCQIARLDQSTLIVVADNPHWSTRFRFFIPQLMTQLKQYPDFQRLKTITCKVRPLNFQKTPISRRTAKLSPENLKLLADTTQEILEKITRNMDKSKP